MDAYGEDYGFMAMMDMVRDAYYAKRCEDFLAMSEDEQARCAERMMASKIEELYADTMPIGPEQGAILRCMVYGVTF